MKILLMRMFNRLSLLGSSVLLTSQIFAAAPASKEAPATAAVEKVNEAATVSPENAAAKANDVNTTSPITNDESAKAPSAEEIASYFETFGWIVANQCGIKNLGTTSEESASFVKGIQDALSEKPLSEKLGNVTNSMQKYFQERAMGFEKKHQEELKVIAEKNRKAGDEYMKDLLKKDPSIKTTSSGLGYKIIDEGDNKNKPTNEDSVKIFYKGTLVDGKVFDESKTEPIMFPLNGVVPGIKEGLQLIGQGGKIKLFIPASLAYGDFDIPGIPAGSLLIFEVELKEVVKTNEAKPASAADIAKKAPEANAVPEKK